MKIQVQNFGVPVVLMAGVLFPSPTSAQLVWVEQGPGPILPNRAYVQASGAINAAAVDPADPARIFVATVNGGVWVTTTGTSASPSWTPLTDDLPSLAISHIAFSPLDPTHNTIYAGFGDFTAGMETGNPRGFARTVDGGAHWTVFMNAIPGDSQTPDSPQRITRLWPTSLTDPGTGQQAILASLRFYHGGVYRSADSGNTFTRVLAGDDGSVDLAPDPGDSQRFYAAIAGLPAQTGIYVTTDGGLNWNKLNNIAGGCCTRLAVSAALDPTTHQRPAYALGDDGTYRSADGGLTWGKLGSFAITRRIYQSSLVADPSNPNVVFVGGVPGVYRWDGSHWTAMEGANASGTDTHDDSRHMVFDSNGNLLECDDGGIYRLLNPNNLSDQATRRWLPLDGNIRCTEMFTAAYDSMNHVFFGGTQDNGVVKQSSANSFQAEEELGGDGGQAAVDNRSEAGHSQHYITYNGDTRIHRHRYGNSNNLLNTGTLPLVVNGSGGSTVYDLDPNAGTPRCILNAVSPTNMLLVTGGGYLFESISPQAGDVVDARGQFNGITAWAYGGFSGGAANRGVIYLGTADGALWLRPSLGGLFGVIATYRGGVIRGIALDPTGWQRAYILDDSRRVWRTTDAGSTWTELTGTGGAMLSSLSTGLSKIVIISHPEAPGMLAVAVAGRGGVYLTRNPDAGTGAVWQRFGDNFPNLLVTDLLYNSTDDVLLTATYGRGAWKLPDAISTVFGLPCPATSPVLSVPVPWPTVRSAYTAAQDCSIIRITAGTYHEAPLTLNKHVRLESQGGPATIGQ